MRGGLLPATPGLWLGVDENGLGARLGPLIVTGVSVWTDERGARTLRRPLSARLQQDLNDSKQLVSNRNIRIAEAWARVTLELIRGRASANPRELLEQVGLETPEELTQHCPDAAKKQCFFSERETFVATDEDVERVRSHWEFFQKRGVRAHDVRSLHVCTGHLNRLRREGVNRFLADLHAMERLILHFAESGRVAALPHFRPLRAVCGKVGGMNQYGRFFGPLSNHLHTVLGEGAAESAYSFPGLGAVSFLRDADAEDPLVMMASLVGKYVRELWMTRIGRFYIESATADLPSGYHDPITRIFVERVRPVRRQLNIIDECFERTAAPEKAPPGTRPRRTTNTSGVPSPDNQGSLFD